MEALWDLVFWLLRELLGLIYLVAWSLSFYPQPIANWRRKSVSGTTVDFPVANLSGFTAYTIYTSGFLFSRTIKQEYAQRHPDSPVSTVRSYDFAFAFHGWIVIAILLFQYYWYDDPEDHSARRIPSRYITGICGTAVFGTLIVAAFAVGDDDTNPRGGLLKWIDVLYTLSAVKLGLTLVKYVPQVLLNAQRRSTEGWTISTILLDATGSIASMLQLILDSVHQGSWRTGVAGNLIKLLLGAYSLFFDAIFIYQHYVAYPTSRKVESVLDAPADEQQPLIGNG